MQRAIKWLFMLAHIQEFTQKSLSNTHTHMLLDNQRFAKQQRLVLRKLWHQHDIMIPHQNTRGDVRLCVCLILGISVRWHIGPTAVPGLLPNRKTNKTIQSKWVMSYIHWSVAAQCNLKLKREKITPTPINLNPPLNFCVGKHLHKAAWK